MRTELRSRRRRVLLGLSLTLAVAGCKRQEPAPSGPAKCVPKLLVAREGTPKIDGELDEPVWHSAAATESFVEQKSNRVVPHTEARAAWDAKALYLALYAADAELQSSDQLRVDFDGGSSIEISPAGAVTCHFGAQSDCAAAGVVAKVDRDGDVDANKEEDEEWAVELRVPWSLLAPSGRPAQLPVNFSRRETLDGTRLHEVWTRGCGALQLASSP